MKPTRFGSRSCVWCGRTFKATRLSHNTCSATHRQALSRHRRFAADRVAAVAVEVGKAFATSDYRRRRAALHAAEFAWRLSLTPVEADQVDRLAYEFRKARLAAEWAIRTVPDEPTQYEAPVPNSGFRVESGCSCRQCRRLDVFAINREARMPVQVVEGRVRPAHSMRVGIAYPTRTVHLQVLGQRNRPSDGGRRDPFASRRVASRRPGGAVALQVAA